jgi:hypothetical protein
MERKKVGDDGILEFAERSSSSSFSGRVAGQRRLIFPPFAADAGNEPK